MVMVDGEMRIIDGNEQLARLTEVPKKILVGSPFDSYFADPAAAHDAVKKTFADGYVTNVDLILKAASGKEIPVSFNASLFYRAGKVFGIFGVARDVTQPARDRAHAAPGARVQPQPGAVIARQPAGLRFRPGTDRRQRAGGGVDAATRGRN